MKQCPFCAEDIRDAAIKCKHCGSWLTEVDDVHYTPRVSSDDVDDSVPYRPVAESTHEEIPGRPELAPHVERNSTSRRMNKPFVFFLLVTVSSVLFLLNHPNENNQTNRTTVGTGGHPIENTPMQLSDATVAEWRVATYRDRLATCKRMVLIAARSDPFWARYARKDLEYAGQELEKCITTAAPEAPSSTRIAEMGAMCLILIESDQ